MRDRARSPEDKKHRSEHLLDAAQSLALELGGVRFVTVASVTQRVGLHRTGVRRYFASREELLLELAERGWEDWRAAVTAASLGRSGLSPAETALLIADTISSLPVFCDLLTHVALALEGEVDIERARRYKTNSFAAHDEIVRTLSAVSTMPAAQIEQLLAAAGILAAGLWQVSHPTPRLAELYRQEPRWEHIAMDFAPRLRQLVAATAIGLS